MHIIEIARSAIELHIRSPGFDPQRLERQLGFEFASNERVMVRLMHYQTNTPRAVSEIVERAPVARAVIKASLSAAFGPQNSVPVSIDELNELVIEVDIMHDPVQLTGSYISKRNEIELGRHGLIVEYGSRKGVVLPSYALEKKLGRLELLEEACIAAGLAKDYWKQPKIRLFKFSVQRLMEETPNGKVKIL
jgi:uncharacterized protein (TIGR00296 family)